MVIALGSSLQVALMVGPLLALLSPLLGHRMTLVFAPVEIVAIATGALITTFVAVHIIFAAVIYVWPIGALGR